MASRIQQVDGLASLLIYYTIIYNIHIAKMSRAEFTAAPKELMVQRQRTLPQRYGWRKATTSETTC